MIYLITNRHLAGVEAFEEVVLEAIDAGVHGVILREKDLPENVLSAYAARFKKALHPYQKLIVHSSTEAALSAGADGVHFSYEDFMALDIARISQLLEDNHLVLGVSVHAVEEALSAAQHGASYLLAGHVFDTDCKAGLPGRGLSFLQTLCQAVTIPVIGLGGMTPENVKSVIEAGAAGAAVMSGIMASETPYAASEAYLKGCS